MTDRNHGLWRHLPVLVRANSKESVEYILQALWRTRKTGLDDADRQIFRQMLQLQNDAELDSLLVCLRILIRRCVYETVNKDDIQNLFPAEVLPELQRLLTLLLQKFHREWHDDVLKDQPEGDARSNLGKLDMKFQLSKDTLEAKLQSIYILKDHLSDTVSNVGIALFFLILLYDAFSCHT
ncbi:unnamed protein product [Coffea canephora]|uniref:DH200=94 genomic scaffold, scaffold_640 n=1 Tax=Coffea canephora TaxID=49390 RepID=A0A068VGQ6_COFCA|nr:unnamed protein product [Coffea canephora]